MKTCLPEVIHYLTRIASRQFAIQGEFDIHDFLNLAECSK